jgi:molecular chaperone DnaK
MSHVIGIDLGTTNSCVAIIETSPTGKVDVKIIPNAEGARTTPSIVGFTASGERLVGQPAKRQAVTNAANTVYAVKRLIGRKYASDEVKRQLDRSPYRIIEAPNGDAWVSVGGKDMSPPEVSAMVLLRMKEIAESYLGETVTDAVVTVPAYFDDAQRQATRDAGKIAGLNVRRIINEPTAAAIAYGLDKKPERIAVYDLGGGTFDISILEISEGVFSVKATNGDTYLGGEDFDLRIVDAIAEAFQSEHSVDLKKDRMALQRLKEAAEKAKHELSSSIETEINLPFIATNAKGEPLHVQKTMKRAELELLVMDLVEKSLEPCRKCLQDAKLNPSDVNSVVLVGGMTRMPAVQKAVKDFFGREPNKGVNPDEVVAAGAAFQGAALEGEANVEMLLLDVTPLSLGVETGGGVFTVLIPRNTTIPTERSEIFTTSVDNQNFVPIHVLQGERPMAADNRSLSRFELTGIPPAPRGVPKIQVTFRIDANGVVSIDAKDLGSGRSQQMNITPTSGLSKDEIDRIVGEGERHQAADAVRKELAELRNQAETLLYTTEAALEGYQDLVDGEMIERTRESCKRLRTLIDGQGDLTSIRSSYQELEALTFKIAESLYGSPT